MDSSYMFLSLLFGFGVSILMIVVGAGMLLMRIFNEAGEVKRANCLLWKHPDNNRLQMAQLVLTYIPQPSDYTAGLAKLERALVKAPDKKLAQLRLAYQKLEGEARKAIALPGGDWYYKYSWLMGERELKWCYEDKEGDTYNLKAYEPDRELREWAELGVKLPTSSELAGDINWEPLKPAFMPDGKVLQKLAQGGTAILGVSCLIGILMLVDML